jgi:sodium transport system permease protein
MNWLNVRLILAREIRDQLRDRRTLIMIVVVPLLLYPLIGMSFFQIAQFLREHATKVLVLGASELDGLEGFPPLLADREAQRFASELFASEGDQSESNLLEIHYDDAPSGDLDALERARAQIQSGEYQLLLYFPPGFGAQVRSFRDRITHRGDAEVSEPPTIERMDLGVFYNAANEKSYTAFARVSRVLKEWESRVVDESLAASNLPRLARNPFQFANEDIAKNGGRNVAIWSKLLPFVLLIWALTGAFYPAVDLCAGEKERGTLETLLSCPAERHEIVWGKLLTIMLFSMATALLNLLSMGVTGVFIIRQLNHIRPLESAAEISAPAFSSLIWLVIALAPISALFSALCLALAAFARSTKEGQYYLMPLMLITMPLMMLPMAPGVELTVGNALIPVTGVMLLLRAMLEGNAMQALPYFPLVVIVTLACCMLAIRWAVDQFNSESVLFRESERLDLAMWARRLVLDRGDTPSIAMAFSCIVIIFVIRFFFTMTLPPATSFADFSTQTFTLLVVGIATPALLMTIILTKRPFRSLSLRRPSRWLALPAAAALALTLHPVAATASGLIQKLYPISPSVLEELTRIEGFLTKAPSLWFLLLLVAVLPAICEELAFRGFILSGLRHIGHKWWAILISSIAFGMAHGILQQSISASLVGAILAYIAIQTGSLFPCMIFHFVHNALLVVSSALLESDFQQRFPWLVRWLVGPGMDGDQGLHYRWPVVAAGLVASLALLAWFRRLPCQMSSEEELQQALDHQDAPSTVEHV